MFRLARRGKNKGVEETIDGDAGLRVRKCLDFWCWDESCCFLGKSIMVDQEVFSKKKTIQL